LEAGTASPVPEYLYKDYIGRAAKCKKCGLQKVILEKIVKIGW
jgi:hypothetical protein